MQEQGCRGGQGKDAKDVIDYAAVIAVLIVIGGCVLALMCA